MTPDDVPVRFKTSTIVVSVVGVLAVLAAALIGLFVFLAGDRIGALLDGERDIGSGFKMFYPGGGAYIIEPGRSVLVPGGDLSRNGGSVGEFARVTIADGDCFIGTIIDSSGAVIGYFTLRPASVTGSENFGVRVREYKSKVEWDNALKDLGITSYRLRGA